MRRDAFSWALYDWANSAYATTVMSGFFPVFFKEYWSAGVPVTVSTFRLGVANSAANLIVALFAPFLGAIADRGGARKRFLLFFAFLGIANTVALSLVAAGMWGAAAFIYILSMIGFAGGDIFYDSLLVQVSGRESVDWVSSLGYALGYLGGGLLFGVNVWMTLSPATFGLASAAQAVRVSFVTVAVWWAAFSIPIFLFVREAPRTGEPGARRALTEGVSQVLSTFRQIRKHRLVFLFLAGYWIYIDGVDTIIRMAVDYGLSLGFSSNSLVIALLITQFVGFPAAIAFGKIGQRLGPKTGIYIGLAVYLGVTIWGYFMHRVIEFYIMAVVIGLVQGGVQSLSRSYYTRLIPREESAEFFGFFNVMGKFATVMGPALMGVTALLFGNPRLSIVSIAIFFVAGGTILAFVREDGKTAPAPRTAA